MALVCIDILSHTLTLRHAKRRYVTLSGVEVWHSLEVAWLSESKPV